MSQTTPKPEPPEAYTDTAADIDLESYQGRHFRIYSYHLKSAR
jgi:hypothetical protein